MKTATVEMPSCRAIETSTWSAMETDAHPVMEAADEAGASEFKVRIEKNLPVIRIIKNSFRLVEVKALRSGCD